LFVLDRSTTFDGVILTLASAHVGVTPRCAVNSKRI
jgi:hypothetical protein